MDLVELDASTAPLNILQVTIILAVCAALEYLIVSTVIRLVLETLSA
jgi:hypothetical protein